MANQWYLQHAGKQHGPLTSATLKKLAAERKITPATQVRLGENGKWVAAGRVQGLFNPAASPPSAAAPPPPPPPRAVDVLAQATAAEPPPPSPLARVPLGSAGKASDETNDDAPVAPRIIAAVGLIFGILALATCWLPMLGGSVGWIGIVVGAIGLLLGIVGLVFSALHRGAALAVNVAGTSSAAVALVLSVVLGITFGMFSPAPAAKPALIVQQPALPPPEPTPEPEPAPQPEPPPEPVWTDAGQAIEQGPIRATIVPAIQTVRLESTDPSVLKAGKPQPMFRVRVKIENISTDRIVEVPGWSGSGSLLGQAGQAAGALLQGAADVLGGDAAKTLQASSATATLVDNLGNNYPQTPSLRLMGAQFAAGENNAVRPGAAVERQVVFEPPLEAAEYVRLELSTGGFGGSEPLRFQIPAEMFGKR